MTMAAKPDKAKSSKKAKLKADLISVLSNRTNADMIINRFASSDTGRLMQDAAAAVAMRDTLRQSLRQPARQWGYGGPDIMTIIGQIDAMGLDDDEEAVEDEATDTEKTVDNDGLKSILDKIENLSRVMSAFDERIKTLEPK